MPGIPDKKSFKVSEVCRLADTQPYVLRFWESEFPQLEPSRSRGGQGTYSREDLELVLRIRELLHEQELSIADARKVLEKEAGGRPGPAPEPAKKVKKAAKSGKKASTDRVAEMRKRYEAACEEIAALREKLEASGDTDLKLLEARKEIERLKQRVRQLRKEKDLYKGKVERISGRLAAIDKAFRYLTGSPAED